MANSNGVWFAGTVNGGVWRTKDINAPLPHWEPVTDPTQDSLETYEVTCVSVGALHVDVNNPNVIYYGCGGPTSAEMGPSWSVTNSPFWGGLFVSKNQGDTWARVAGFPAGYWVTDIQSYTPTATALAADRDGLNGSGPAELAAKGLLVSARGTWEGEPGGIWQAPDGFQGAFTQTLRQPVFDLQYFQGGVVFATIAESKHTVMVSNDEGASWKAATSGEIAWSNGFLPFYSSLTITSGAAPYLVLVGLTVDPKNTSDTFSDLFYAPLTPSSRNGNDNGDALAKEVVSSVVFTKVKNQPFSLDEDSMPKDRAAVLADPKISSMVYVAGNAGAVVWRVNFQQGKWENLYGGDTRDNTAPHCDCRNWAWEPETESLVLVSDGGVFMRSQPRTKGGSWRGVQGDMMVMEFYNVAWDTRAERFVAGAQDNCVQYSAPGSNSSAVALCAVGGDGTVVQVDNVNCPARLWGATQFAGGLSFVTGYNQTAKQRFVPLSQYFPDAWSVPFFQQAFVVNPLDPNQLAIAINVTEDGGPTGIYVFDIPEKVLSPEYEPNATHLYHALSLLQRDECLERLNEAGISGELAQQIADLAASNRVARNHGTGLGELIGDALTDARSGNDGLRGYKDGDDDDDLTCTKLDLDWDSIQPLLQDLSPGAWPKPRRVVTLPSPVYVFEMGAYVDGKPDPLAFAGINNSHVFTSRFAGSLEIFALPTVFAQPLDFVTFLNDSIPVLGPVTHGKTVSLGMAPWDASILAVSGWPSIVNNSGKEDIFLSLDAGASWQSVLANLAQVCHGVPNPRAPIRPSSPIFIDEIWAGGPNVMLVGTTTGVYFTGIEKSSTDWIRVGLCSELPLVKVEGLSYDAYSDILSVATFGRGIYILRSAKAVLSQLFQSQQKGQCVSYSSQPSPSSARWLPPQHTCK